MAVVILNSWLVLTRCNLLDFCAFFLSYLTYSDNVVIMHNVSGCGLYITGGPDNPYSKRQKRRKNIFQPLVGVCEYIE